MEMSATMQLVAAVQGTMGNGQTEARILEHLQKLAKAGEDAPHIEQLARELKMSRLTVARYVQSLERSGSVIIVPKGTMKIIKLAGGT